MAVVAADKSPTGHKLQVRDVGRIWRLRMICAQRRWHCVRRNLRGVSILSLSDLHMSLRTQKSALAARVAAGVLLVFAVATSGCAQRVFRANKLPGEFAAPPVENVQTIDLSRLSAASVSNEQIECGDALEISVHTGHEDSDIKTLPVRVADDGTVDIVAIGRVQVAGLRVEIAEQAIATAAMERRVFHRPHVTIKTVSQRIHRVTVVGGVKEPGTFDLPRGSSTLLAALVQAGGLSDAAGADVEIRRSPTAVARRPQGPNQLAGYATPPAEPAVQSMHVRLTQLTQENGLVLEDGDVVMVEKRDPQPIHVMGLVRKAGKFDVPANKEVRLLDSLALAGERSVPWAEKVVVVRHVPGEKEPILIKVNLRDAKRDGAHNIRLAPGDVVSVEETPATFVYEMLSFIRVGASAALY